MIYNLCNSYEIFLHFLVINNSIWMCLKVLFGFLGVDFEWVFLTWNTVHTLDCHAEGWNNKPGIKDFSLWRWTDQSPRGAESPAARNYRAGALHRVWESTAGTSSATSAGFTTGNQFSKAVWKTQPPKNILSWRSLVWFALRGRRCFLFPSLFAHVFSYLHMCSVLIVVRIFRDWLKSLKVLPGLSPSLLIKGIDLLYSINNLS